MSFQRTAVWWGEDEVGVVSVKAGRSVYMVFIRIALL